MLNGPSGRISVARQTAADHFLALTNGVPVGYVDTGAIAFTVDPVRQREGLATRMIRALIEHPDLSTVELFDASVEPKNHASRRTLEAAGFHLRSPEPDCEEMLYYELWAPDRRAT